MASDNDKRLVPADRSSDPLLDPLAQPPVAQDRSRGGYGYGGGYGGGYGYNGGYGYGGAAEQQGGFTIRDIWRIIYKSKWMIITLVLMTTVIVTLASFKVDNQYHATATVQIEDPNQNLTLKDGLVVGSSEKYYRTQLRLIKMPALVRRVVVELDLENNPNFFSSSPATLSDAIASLIWRPGRAPAKAGPLDAKPPVDLSKPLDDASIQRLSPYVGTIAARLNVEEVPATQLINIAYQHHNPEIAAKVANSIAETFVKENMNQRMNSKTTASDFLQRRIAELQSQIRTGEERLLNYARSNEILALHDGESSGEKPNVAAEQLGNLNADLLKAQQDRQALEVTRELMKKNGVTDAMRQQILQQDTQGQELSRTLVSLRQRRTELLERYTEVYPEVKNVNQQIALAESEMEKVNQRIAVSAQAKLKDTLEEAEKQYQVALTRENNLRQAFDSQRGQMMQQNEAAISYRMLKQEVETNKSFLNMLLGRQKEIDISAVNEVNNANLKDRAEVPGGPIGPDRRNWILLSFALSLVGGLGLAFGRERLDQTIKSIEDIDRVARLPSLGIIPALGMGQDKRSRKALAARSRVNTVASSELITSLATKSSAAEAYRQLRTSVLLSSAGHPSKLLLVTSSQPREGKTTTAVNTAISLAQTGARTIIVDCDMRKPRVHQLLGSDNTFGISLYLSGQREELNSLIQPHQTPNLSVLACGPIPPNPAELLGSDQMRKLLTELSETFDHVVVDSPPVVSFADAVILSTMVDGVILVVRGGFTSKGIILRSRQLLGEVGAKIYGVVLNDADMKSSDSYYYYNYNNYYYKSDPSEAKLKEQQEAEK